MKNAFKIIGLTVFILGSAQAQWWGAQAPKDTSKEISVYNGYGQYDASGKKIDSKNTSVESGYAHAFESRLTKPVKKSSPRLEHRFTEFGSDLGGVKNVKHEWLIYMQINGDYGVIIKVIGKNEDPMFAMPKWIAGFHFDETIEAKIQMAQDLFPVKKVISSRVRSVLNEYSGYTLELNEASFKTVSSGQEEHKIILSLYNEKGKKVKTFVLPALKTF